MHPHNTTPPHSTFFQGENNVIQGGPSYYNCALPALISSWRQAFGQPNLFFGIMQLAAYVAENNTLLAEIRDVQLNTTLSTPFTAIASATDLGDLYSPEGNIHPRTKVVNSRRMARAAAGVIYGVPGSQRGPTYAGAVALPGGVLSVRVDFEPATLAQGLVLQPPTNLPNDPHLLPPYNFAWPALLGSDGTWRNASWALGGVNNTSLLLTAEGAPQGVVPIASSMAFGNWPANVLYNSEGLPAMPWRRWL